MCDVSGYEIDVVLGCNADEKLKECLDPFSSSWDIEFLQENYLDKFEKSKVTYLTAESDNVLEQLDDDRIYIIGGLVDHNHHIGLCHSKATEASLATARLPIAEHMVC